MKHAPDRAPKGRADNDRAAGAASAVRPVRPLAPAPSTAKRLTAEVQHG